MTEEECEQIYNQSRVYFTHYTNKAAFIASYMSEFGSIPLNFFTKLLDKHKNDRQMPSINTFKNDILRQKWILQCHMLDAKRNGSMNEKLEDKYLAAIEQTNQALNGYDEDMETDEEFMEYYKTVQPNPKKSVSLDQEDEVLIYARHYNL